MFGMRRWFSVRRDHRPAVAQYLCFRRSDVQHRFDGKTISGPNFLASSCTAVIRNLRSFVHFAANAMSGVITDYAVAVFLRVFLNDRSDVANAFVWPALRDAKLQTFFRHTNKVF